MVDLAQADWAPTDLARVDSDLAGADSADSVGFGWAESSGTDVGRTGLGRLPVVLLVGGGNNGGDALFAGAFLARRGWQVRAVLVSADPHRDALTAAVSAGVTICGDGVVAAAAGRQMFSGATIVVDGVCGLGLSGVGGLRGEAAQWAQLCEDNPQVRVVSVDVPSGVVPDVGELPGGVAFKADVTVACVGLLRCHVEWPVAELCGRVVVADVAGAAVAGGPSCASGNTGSGTPDSGTTGSDLHAHVTPDLDGGVLGVGVLCGERALAATFTAGCAGRVYPVPGRTSHKFSRGVVGVLAGSSRYRGAAVLAVRAAYAAGAGLVVLVADEPVATDVLRECPEVVVCSRSDFGDGQGVPSVDVWLVGPGLDIGEGNTAQVLAVLWAGQLPVVADASALRWLPVGCFGVRGGPTVLTPHAGELRAVAEIWGVQQEDSVGESSLPRLARELVGGWVTECGSGTDGTRPAVTVVVKGAPTVVVQHGAPDLVLEPDCPWLATAGSGDVLAGVVAALVAATDDIQLASATGVYVHAAAGRVAAAGGPIRASDVINAVNPAIGSLLSRRVRVSDVASRPSCAADGHKEWQN